MLYSPEADFSMLFSHFPFFFPVIERSKKKGGGMNILIIHKIVKNRVIWLMGESMYSVYD